MKGFLLLIDTVVTAMVLKIAAATEETHMQQLQQQQLRGGVRKLNLEQGICHAVGGTNKEEYLLLSGIPIMALTNHMEQHGDGIPGGPVPHKPDCTFSPTCEIQCPAVCPCWPEGKPTIAVGDVTEYNSADIGYHPTRGYEEEFEFGTVSGVRMRANFEDNQTTCGLKRDTIITTREEHEVCVKDIVDAAVDNVVANQSSIRPVCQRRPSAPFYNVSCPCWKSVDALPAPTKVPFEKEKYLRSDGWLTARVDVGNDDVLTVDTRNCRGPGTRASPSPEEAEVCYDQLLEYARYYNSTNRCHDPWRDKGIL